MKKLNKMLSIGVMFSFLLTTAAFAELKIGYINSQAILAKLKETKDADDKLQELYKKWELEAKNMQQEILKKQEDFEAKSLMLTDKAKAERAQELQTLTLKLRQFQQEKFGPQGEYFKENQRLTEPIVKKVQEAINKIAEEEGFDFIFDTVNAGILYANKKHVDLTERVIQELEKQTPTATSNSEKTN